MFHTLSDVKSISPSTGSENGGQLVTITGTGFDAAETEVKVEKFISANMHQKTMNLFINMYFVSFHTRS